MVQPLTIRSVVMWCCMCACLGPLEAAASTFSKNCRPELVDVIKVSSIASAMSVGGVDQNILKIESKASRDEVAKAYKVKWRHTHAEPLDAREAGDARWLIISKIVGKCLHTVQLLKQSAVASGYISVRDINVDNDFQQVVLGKSFPKPYGSVVLSDIMHNDPGKKARTLMLTNNFSVDTNAEFFLTNIGNEGWTVFSDHQVPMQKRNTASRAITFGKGREQQIVVITESSSGSRVVAQWMEQP